MTDLRAFLPLMVSVVTACGPAAKPVPTPRSSPTIQLPAFVGERDRDHPLVGKWFDPAASRFIELDEVLARAIASSLVGIGETHDDADHHAVQALIVRTTIARGRRPAIVLEMVDEDRQAAIDAGRARGVASAEDFALLVDWAHSGWPAFEMYRPIVAAALEAELPLIAGDPPRTAMRALGREGRASLASGDVERLLLDRAWDAPADASLRQELVDDHCGMLPAGSKVIDGMVLAERARDASFAHHMVDAKGDGAVLIAGSGHVRADRGVPWALRAIEARKAMLSIGLIEVEAGKVLPADYAERYVTTRLPFDVVLFTPSPSRADPCEGMRTMRPPPP